MYTLYTDKTENFKCNIEVEGTNLEKTKARLVLESSNVSLLFEGKINSNGDCMVPIKKLKGLLGEGETGTMKLEVIADDTFFSPWDDKFSVKTNKKVKVDFNIPQEQINENKIRVKVNKPRKTHSEVLLEIFDLKGITKSNLKENIDVISPLIENYIKKFKINTPSESLITEIFNKLK